MTNNMKITFSDKTYLNQNASIPENQKMTDDNINEIKNVVNSNDDNTNQNATSIGDLNSLNTTNKNNLVDAVNEVNTKTNNMMAVILYENNSGISSGTITLNDIYTNYEKIEVATNIGVTGIIYPSYNSQVVMSASIYSDALYTSYLGGEFSSNKLTIQNNGTYYLNSNHTDNHKIFKIVGYKKSDS